MLEGDWSAKSGYSVALELIRHYRCEFTALVTANDHMALGALSAFRENGIEVPDDISVIGYDGMPESQFYRPSLSTIYQDFAALGEVSVEFLLRMINQPSTSPQRFILKPVLVPRRSTAPPNRQSKKKPRIDANKGIRFVFIRVDSRLEKSRQRTKAKTDHGWTLMDAKWI